MKLSEIAAKVGGKTEPEIILALDDIVRLANERRMQLANGDYPGHPFHGNQFVGAEEAAKSESGSGAHHMASKKAHEASKAAKTTVEHRKAAHLHMKAAKLHEEEGNDETARYHEEMAKDHLHAAGANKRDRDYLESKYGKNSVANEIYDQITGALRKAMKKDDAPLTEVLSFANDLPIVPHEGMNGDVIGELHKQLTKCMELQKTKANEILVLTKARQDSDAAKDAAEKQFANERKARVDMLIDLGLKSGKIVLAEKDQWIKDFANEGTFAITLDRYGKLVQKLPTTTHVTAAGQQNGNTVTRNDQIATAVQTTMANEKCTYDEAWTKVKKAQPGLFAGMKEPGAERSAVV